MALDGVAQAPGAEGEGTADGFKHGVGICAVSTTSPTKPKYVVSTTLSRPVVWQNSMVLQGGDGLRRPLRLIESQVTTTGAILATYAPEDG